MCSCKIPCYNLLHLMKRLYSYTPFTWGPHLSQQHLEKAMPLFPHNQSLQLLHAELPRPQPAGNRDCPGNKLKRSDGRNGDPGRSPLKTAIISVSFYRCSCLYYGISTLYPPRLCGLTAVPGTPQKVLRHGVEHIYRVQLQNSTYLT